MICRLSCGPMHGYLPMVSCRHTEKSQTVCMDMTKAWETCMDVVRVS